MDRRTWLGGAVLVAAAATHAEPTGGMACTSASIKQLKASYLACADLMAQQRVEAAVARRCAAIGRALQQRGFDGDFDRLIAWWQRERTVAQTPLAGAPLPMCTEAADAVRVTGGA